MADPVLQPDARAWLDDFAARLGVDAPDDATVELLLDLAGVAAHASQRQAAPLACWMVGRAGLGPEAALALSREVRGSAG